MNMLLVVNTGSSSVKFRLFGLALDLPLIAGGKVTDIGVNAVFKAKKEGGADIKENLAAKQRMNPLSPLSCHGLIKTIWAPAGLRPRPTALCMAERAMTGLFCLMTRPCFICGG